MCQSLKGTYVFKQNGVEIGRSENLITTNGRTSILQYLSGLRQDWAADMAIGALSTTPSISDVELNFETARYPVTLKTFLPATSNNPDLIVVRTLLPEDLVANIYEIGLYPSRAVSGVNSSIIADFSDLSQWHTVTGTTETVPYLPQVDSSPRIGSNSVTLEQSTKYTNDNLSLSFSHYTPLDKIEILLHNSVAGSLYVQLVDVVGNTQTLTLPIQTNSDYFKVSASFDQNLGFASTDTSIVNFQYLTSLSIATDASAAATIDAIKVSTAAEQAIEDSILSKSVLTTPIAKIYNVPIDVEYYVEML